MRSSGSPAGSSDPAAGAERPVLESHPCNLCGSPGGRFYAKKFGLRIVICRSCGLGRVEPRLSEADIWKRYSPDYLYHDYLPVFHADRSGVDLNLVVSHYIFYLKLAGRVFSPGGRLLDVGCGPGLFLKAAEGQGWAVEGVEVSPSAAEYASAVLKVPVRQSKLEQAGYPDASFDVVTLLDTLEHLGDPLATLAEIRRVLKPGGRLILNTPDFASSSRAMLGKAWAVLTPAEHLFYFREGTLRRMLEKAGFEIPVLVNLLRLNAGFTNSPSALRSRVWKWILGRPKAKKILENAPIMEYSDLLTTGPGRPVEDPATATVFTAGERRSVRTAKRCLRGDILLAVGVKARVQG